MKNGCYCNGYIVVVIIIDNFHSSADGIKWNELRNSNELERKQKVWHDDTPETKQNRTTSHYKTPTTNDTASTYSCWLKPFRQNKTTRHLNTLNI